MSQVQYVNDVIASLRKALAKRGYGLLHLRNEFIEADTDHNGNVSWDEFQNLLRRVKLNPSQNDMRLLFHHLDKDSTNTISPEEFIAVMRDDISPFRRQLIRRAFDKIDSDGDGIISMGDIGREVSFRDHPEVKNNKISTISFMIDFLDTMNHITDRGEFTFPEFLEYYGSIAAYDTDESFEESMNGMWGLARTASKVQAKNRREGRRIQRIINGGSSSSDSGTGADEEKSQRDLPLPPPGVSSTLFNVAVNGPVQQGEYNAAVVAEESGITLGLAKIVINFRSQLQQHGGTGFIAVQRKFRIADDDGNKRLDFAEFKKALTETGMDLDKDEMMSLFRYFDKDHDNSVDFEELLQGVRAPLTKKRMALIHMAFDRLDSKGKGVIEGDDIADNYDASRHPDVIAGRKTPEMVLSEFLRTFDVGGEVDGKVTRQEFVNYYHNISASIDHDDYFELMIRNAWHISGGEGWSANSANLRVLVTHSDGTQSVQEVKNDLGLRSDDKAGIIYRLRTQGVDVLSIDTKGAGADSASSGDFNGTKKEAAGSGQPAAAGSSGSNVKLGAYSTASAAGYKAAKAPPKQILSLEEQREKAKQPQAAVSIDDSIDPRVLDPSRKSNVQPSSMPTSHLGLPHGIQSVVNNLKKIMKERGAHGYIGLQRKFRSIDTNGNNYLDYAEFSQALREMNLRLDSVDSHALFNYFDTDQSGTIDINEFVSGMRDRLNPRRYALVQSAFSRIDADGSGVVDGGDLAQFYDPSQHPDVLAGKRSPESILEEFLSTFDVGGEVDGKVTRQEFVNYYHNISASIDNDDYFELMIRNAWHISGGEGWSANSANLRVLVTHSDGSQTVEELKNDMGIRPDDTAGIMLRLRSQGISAASVDVMGGVDSGGDQISLAPLETVKHRHNGIIQSRRIHERGRETTSTLPGSARLVYKDGKYVDTRGDTEDHHVVVPKTVQPRPDVESRRILAALKDEFRARGVRGLVGLQRKMRNLGTKSLSRGGMKAMLKDLSISLDDAEFRALFDHLDAASVGAVGFTHFLDGVRRPLSDRRLELVKRAFVHIGRNVADWGTDYTKSITLLPAERAARQYDASRHPEVVRGTFSEEDQIREFLETMDVGEEEEGMVSLNEWLNYHTNVSCTIESDEVFEETIRGVWHFSSEDELEQSKVRGKKGIIDPAVANGGRIAGAPTREYGHMYARRHNSGGMSDAIGIDFSPAPDPKEMATLHRKQLLARTHASSVVRDAMAIGDLSEPAKEEIRVSETRRRLLKTTHDSSQMVTAMYKQEQERRDGTTIMAEARRTDRQQQQQNRLGNGTILTTRKKLSPQIKILVAKLQHKLASRGAAGGFVGLQRAFRNMDEDHNNQLSHDEFTQGMMDIGVGLSLPQIDALFHFFDQDSSGSIDFTEFLVGIREPLNKRRSDLVHLAFNILDKDGSGAIEPNDVVSVYDATQHPDVIAGNKSVDDVLSEFLNTFDVGGEVDGKVTRQEFENYYSNISASIDNDDYFEVMIRNVWHISGGVGVAANTANKRVLVTHTNGRQTVAEVKDDMGLNMDDEQEVIRRLRNQGVEGIKRVDLFG